jgi:hypothetical protein
MKLSTERTLTTHVGSLPRDPALSKILIASETQQVDHAKLNTLGDHRGIATNKEFLTSRRSAGISGTSCCCSHSLDRRARKSFLHRVLVINRHHVAQPPQIKTKLPDTVCG